MYYTFQRIQGSQRSSGRPSPIRLPQSPAGPIAPSARFHLLRARQQVRVPHSGRVHGREGQCHGADGHAKEVSEFCDDLWYYNGVE